MMLVMVTSPIWVWRIDSPDVCCRRAVRYRDLEIGTSLRSCMADQSQIGFVGIGAMGWHMAGHLARKQFPVAVYDIDRERQQRFVQAHQCRSAPSLADLGRDVSTVITMLPTGRDVRD